VEPHLQVEGLSKRFGPFWAVRHVSFRLDAGEVLGFLGPNGAGKSTTMRMITGYFPASAGRVAVCGLDSLANPVAARARIGYLPEGAPLYGDMTAAGFLDFIAKMRRLRGAAWRRRREWLVERLGLAEVWQRPIDTLSKGFKRRVGLAQAILHDPDILILDEPTDGLDPNQKHEVRELLREMSANKAIIVSTHILEEVSAVCSRAIVISQGRLIADAPPAVLFGFDPPEEVFRRLTVGPAVPASIDEEAALGHV